MDDNENGPQDFRMDFVQQVVDYEEQEDGTINATFAATPNPERYERIDEDDRSGWLDTYENAFVPDSTLQDMVGQMIGTPIFHSPKDIDDIYDYVSDRMGEMDGFLRNEQPQTATKISEGDLDELAENNQNRFVILCIDIVDSTNLSESLQPHDFQLITQLFMREMSLLVDSFGGYVLDYRGDGLIGYFPEPDYIGMHDNAVDCATSMRQFIIHGMNEILKQNSLPEISFRIGIDSGDIEIVPVAPGVSEEMEIIGHTINLASKIESVAESDSIYMGRNIERNLHTQWRKNTHLVEDIPDWEYKKYGDETYSVHEIHM